MTQEQSDAGTLRKRIESLSALLKNAENKREAVRTAFVDNQHLARNLRHRLTDAKAALEEVTQ